MNPNMMQLLGRINPQVMQQPIINPVQARLRRPQIDQTTIAESPQPTNLITPIAEPMETMLVTPRAEQDPLRGRLITPAHDFEAEMQADKDAEARANSERDRMNQELANPLLATMNPHPNFKPTSGYEDFADDPSHLGDVTKAEYQHFEKGRASKYINMTPDEYLKRVNLGFDSNLPEGSRKGTDYAAQRDMELASKYAEDMKRGDKFPAPVIDTSKGYFSQEGIHRAHASNKLGIKDMPVLMVDKSNPSVDEQIDYWKRRGGAFAESKIQELKQAQKTNPKDMIVRRLKGGVSNSEDDAAFKVHKSANQNLRKNGRVVVRVDAELLANALEKDKGDKLAWNPKRTDHLKTVIEPHTDYPSVDLTKQGALSVGDGNHRIDLARQRKQAIDIAVMKKDAQMFKDFYNNKEK